MTPASPVINGRRNDPAISFTSDDRKDGVFSVAELAINPPSSELMVTLTVTDLAGKTASTDIAVKVTLKLEQRAFLLQVDGNPVANGDIVSTYVGKQLALTIAGVTGAVSPASFSFASDNTAVATVAKGGFQDATVKVGDSVGTAVITVTQAADSVYAQAVMEFTLRAQALKDQASLQIVGDGVDLATFATYANGVEFKVTTTGGSGTGAVFYESTDTSVVTVDPATGVVNPGNTVGTATITATKASDGEYAATTATYTYTSTLVPQPWVIEIKDPTTNLSVNGTVFTGTRGTVEFYVNFNGNTVDSLPTTGATVESSNPLVATVEGFEVDRLDQISVTFAGEVGETSITVTYPATDVFQAVTASFTYRVGGLLPNTMSFYGGAEITSITCDATCDASDLTMQGFQNGGGTGGQFSFVSSQPDVVEIQSPNAVTGNFTVYGKKAGQSTITATRSADDVYEAVSVSFVYTVPLIANTMHFYDVDEEAQITTINCTGACYPTSVTLQGHNEGGGGGGKITVISDDPSIAKVMDYSSASSILASIQGIKAGTTTITATRTADDIYDEVVIRLSYTVTRGTTTLELRNIDTSSALPATSEMTIGSPMNVGLTVTDNANGGGDVVAGVGTLNISSNNPEILSVTYVDGSNTAQLVPVSPGTATITARRAADDLFEAVERTYTVTVKALERPFIFTVNAGPTSSASDLTIKLTLTGDFVVDWGDGTTTASLVPLEHTYAEPGKYTISVSGSFPSLSGSVSIDGGGFLYGHAIKLLSVDQWGTQPWTDLSYAFWQAWNMQMLATDTPNLSQVTSLNNMFEGATAFNQDISNWDVSSVTDMSGMFDRVTLSPQNYDAMLIAWNTLGVSGITFSAGKSQYTTASASARQGLIDKGWMITDGGAVAPPLAFVDVNGVDVSNYETMVGEEPVRLLVQNDVNASQLMYSSSHTQFATVDQNGVVTPGKRAGTTLIIVSGIANGQTVAAKILLSVLDYTGVNTSVDGLKVDNLISQYSGHPILSSNGAYSYYAYGNLILEQMDGVQNELKVYEFNEAGQPLYRGVYSSLENESLLLTNMEAGKAVFKARSPSGGDYVELVDFSDLSAPTHLATYSVDDSFCSLISNDILFTSRGKQAISLEVPYANNAVKYLQVSSNSTSCFAKDGLLVNAIDDHASVHTVNKALELNFVAELPGIAWPLAIEDDFVFGAGDDWQLRVFDISDSDIGNQAPLSILEDYTLDGVAELARGNTMIVQKSTSQTGRTSDVLSFKDPKNLKVIASHRGGKLYPGDGRYYLSFLSDSSTNAVLQSIELNSFMSINNKLNTVTTGAAFHDYTVSWNDQYDVIDCESSGGSCVILEQDFMNKQARVRWNLPQAAGQYEIVITGGTDSHFSADYDRIIVLP
ncbi:MAG: BspA family leucine-rich repeat surface protein [Marinagarivorans sp.]|nr:BspA family leucine-rich repeat surface protein [Marinagarivorans sp.]